MEVKKYANTNTLSRVIFERGDIFRTDSSYSITDISEDLKILHVEQALENSGQLRFDAPICSGSDEKVGQMLRHLDFARINIRDKFFIVADYSDDTCTALQCSATGNVNEQGISIQFFQSQQFNSIRYPYYVGHRDCFATAGYKKYQIS